MLPDSLFQYSHPKPSDAKEPEVYFLIIRCDGNKTILVFQHFTISDTDISIIKQQRDRKMPVYPGNIIRCTQKYLL